MPAPLSAEAKVLIDRPNFAHLATLMADGPTACPSGLGARAIGSWCARVRGR